MCRGRTFSYYLLRYVVILWVSFCVGCWFYIMQWRRNVFIYALVTIWMTIDVKLCCMFFLAWSNGQLIWSCKPLLFLIPVTKYVQICRHFIIMHNGESSERGTAWQLRKEVYLMMFLICNLLFRLKEMIHIPYYTQTPHLLFKSDWLFTVGELKLSEPNQKRTHIFHSSSASEQCTNSWNKYFASFTHSMYSKANHIHILLWHHHYYFLFCFTCLVQLQPAA